MKVMKNQYGYMDGLGKALLVIIIALMVIAALVGAAVGAFAKGLPSELTEMQEQCEADLPRDEVCVFVAIPEQQDAFCPQAEVFNQAEVLK